MKRNGSCCGFLWRPSLAQKPQRGISPTVGSTHSQSGTFAELNRAPSRALRRAIFIRDGEKCTKCGSKWTLEVDHIHPWAKGGETKLENLRVLCRSCNQREAFKEFKSA